MTVGPLYYEVAALPCKPVDNRQPVDKRAVE